MKKQILKFFVIIAVLGVNSFLINSCTDILGDGEETIFYEGSELPQNTSYRNPVWEPDFELGTIFKGASSYTAIASETEWATGLKYCAPILTSSNLMEWEMSTNTAFPYTPDTLISGTDTTVYVRPAWAEGRVHSMTAGFTKTIPGTSYWLFYQLGDEPAIGVASGRSAKGPYSDYGKLFDAETIGSTSLKDPFFLVKGTSNYLFFSTENGSYVQQLSIKRNQIPVLVGEPLMISGKSFGDVSVYSKGVYFYIFGTVIHDDKSEIRYARSESITGPYVDINGKSLIDGDGALLIESGETLVNPYNVCGIFPDYHEDDFILYNVTDISKPTLPSGYNRRPLMLNKLKLNEEAWIDSVISPQVGWTSPKFADKE